MDIKKACLHQRYDIAEVIQKGNHRVVYRALDRKNGDIVAIKQMYTVDEVEILQKLSNIRGIIPMLDFFSEKDCIYYVMPFLSGGTLRSFREKRRQVLSEEITVRLLESVFQTVRQMHQAEIIHRDISPDNLMFDEKQQLWLIDFGAARNMKDSTIPQSVQLRNGYAPPEQYSLQYDQGTWTDVYALCAVIYYLVTGAEPISARERMNGAYLLPLKALGMSSQKFSDCVMKGLELNEKYRFQNVEEMMKEFGKKK